MINMKWTEAEIQLLRDHYLTEGKEWCARRLNVTTKAISRAAQRFKIAIPKGKLNDYWTTEDDEFLME